jgi:DnaJ like chaperone protein
MKMKWTGKILGAAFGTMFLGIPIGLVLGMVAGHLFDIGYFASQMGSAGARSQSATLSQLFFDCTFSIMGFIAKADGRVSQQEINLAERIMTQMQLQGAKRERAKEQFRLGKAPTFNYVQTLAEFKRACWRRPSLLRLFLEIQVQVASADGVMSAATKTALQQVFKNLGVPFTVFNRYSQQSRAGYRYQSQQSQSTQNPRQQLADAYKILQVASTATDAEIKKAYRRMMSKHHPDRMEAKGVPPEMIKLANQKTQQVKQAYDTITKLRPTKH